MRHSVVHITERNADKLFTYDFNFRKGNDLYRRKITAILRSAIKNELTDKQRYCLCEHIYKGRSMKEIASELGVSPSTVTRHIQNARKRLKNVARYYQ